MSGEKIDAPADRRRTIRRRFRRTSPRRTTATSTATQAVTERLANPNHETPVITCKRKEGHQPKSSDEKYGIPAIIEIQSSIGELKEQLPPKISEAFVEELATSLFNDYKEEFVQKVRCAVNESIKAFPEFNIDMEKLSADISSEGEEIEPPTDGRRKIKGQQGTDQPGTTGPSTIAQTILESIIEEICSYGGIESESIEQPNCGDTSVESSWLVQNHGKIRKLYEQFTPEVVDTYFDEVLTRVINECKEKVHKKATSMKIRLMNTSDKFREDNLNRFGNIDELSSDISSEDEDISFSKSGCFFLKK